MKTKVCNNFLTGAEMARYYGVSKTTILNATKKGILQRNSKTKKYNLMDNRFGYRNKCKLQLQTKPLFIICGDCGKMLHIDNYYSYNIHTCKKCCSGKAKRYTNFNTKYSKINPVGKIYFKACWTCGKINPIDHYKGSKWNKWSCCDCKKAKERKKSRCNTCKINIKTKVYFHFCKSCGKLYSLDQLKYKDGLCHNCSRLIDTKYNTVCLIEPLGKQYFRTCPKCKTVKRVKEYYNNKTKIATYCTTCLKEKVKYEIDNLSDTYIKKRIQLKTGIPAKNIPEGLIESQRSCIKLQRAIKGVCP